MRVLLSFLLLSATFLPTTAQDVLDKVAKESCPCVDDVIKDSTEAAMTKLGVCMLTHAMPYKKEQKKKYGVDLATQCPGFTEFVVRLTQDAAEEEVELPPPTAIKIITGVVQETHSSAFLTALVRTEDGTSYELLLDHVANAERVYQDPGRPAGWPPTGPTRSASSSTPIRGRTRPTA